MTVLTRRAFLGALMASAAAATAVTGGAATGTRLTIDKLKAARDVLTAKQVPGGVYWYQAYRNTLKPLIETPAVDWFDLETPLVEGKIRQIEGVVFTEDSDVLPPETRTS